MQTSKKDNSIYIKQLDKMEEYFLNILKRYFDNTENNIQDCAETIIIEAVKRAKKEILFKIEKSNVLSVNNKMGDVKITISDLGGEPAIVKKYNGFNKPFGNVADTICEGNDSRLSDARTPKPHTHDDIYIRKLKVDVATTTDNGFMSWEDKIKLNGLEKYIHPNVAGFKHIPAGGEIGQFLINTANGEVEWTSIGPVTYKNNGFMLSDDKKKLDSINENANNYVHPDKHSPSIISQDKNNRFVTDEEKETWNSKALSEIVTTQTPGLMSADMFKKLNAIEENANEYTHPDVPGSYHIPTGGNTGDILKWKADGKAQWGIPDMQPIIENPIGDNGQTYFINKNASNEIAPSYLLYKANIVNTKAELISQKEKEISFSDVFNNWKRFSHNGSIEPSVESEMQNWIYKSDTDSVECNINSTSYIGFVSNDKYNKYIHEVTVKSTNSDDDAIGVVVAFVTDQNGKQHTLSAIRRRDSYPYWFLQYDYLKDTNWRINSINKLSGDDISGDAQNSTTTGWDKVPNGSRIRVERDGDIINVYASPFNSTVIDNNSKMTIDLKSDSRLNIFRGSCSYGYSCNSQNLSTFSNISFSGGLDTSIYDVLNNQVWQYNNGWSVNEVKRIQDDLKVGRFVFNNNTKKLFYIDSESSITCLNDTSSQDSSIIFKNSMQGIRWNKDTDGGAIYMSIEGDDGDNRLIFETNDNGTEWFEWIHRGTDNIINRWMSLKNNELKVGDVKVNSSSGPSTNRPLSPSVGDAPYFDTTLKKPIWWNGSAWVDATGTIV